MSGKDDSYYYDNSQYYDNKANPPPGGQYDKDAYYDDSQYYGKGDNSQYYDNGNDSQYYDDRGNKNGRYESQYYEDDSKYYGNGDDSRYYDNGNDSQYYDDHPGDNKYDDSQYYDNGNDSRYYDDSQYDVPPRNGSAAKPDTSRNVGQPRDSVSEFNAYYDDDEYDDPPRADSSRLHDDGKDADHRPRDSRYDSRYDDPSYRDSRYNDQYDDSRYDDSRYDQSYRDSRYDDSRYDQSYRDSRYDSRYDQSYRDSRYNDQYDDSRYDDSRYDDRYRDSRYDDSRYDDPPAPANGGKGSPGKIDDGTRDMNKMMGDMKIKDREAPAAPAAEDENICFSCGKPIKGKAHPKNGHVYCAKDYVMLFAPKCKKCQKPIKGETVCALGAKYHKACFSCITCNKPFPDKSFYVFNNNPVCRRHYHQLNNSLCTKCDEPIEGPCAEVIEGRFHPNCFVCTVCHTPLTGLYYNYQGEAYCEEDIMRIHKERINKANKRRTIMSYIE